MHFKTPRQNKRNNIDIDIRFGNTPLEKVERIKFLGVIVDERMSWKKHSQHFTCKVRSSICSLYDMRRTIPKNLKIVYTMLLSTLNFLMPSRYGVLTL
jgi:hypothetical protein